MNIFRLDDDPAVAAYFHCDKHVGKMLIESCQMLAAAQHLLGGTASYKLTHQNHPCAIWVRQSDANYLWLRDLAQALGMEFFDRYGKTHKSHLVLQSELAELPPNIPRCPATPVALAMPDEFKMTDAVYAYQIYYASKRKAFKMTWHGSDIGPKWFEEICAEELAA